MIVLGVVLMVGAAVVAAGVLVGNEEPMSVSFFGITISNASGAAIFAAGLLVATVLLVGLAVSGSGLARARRMQRERRRILEEHRTSELEVARLEKELAAAKASRAQSDENLETSDSRKAGSTTQAGSTAQADLRAQASSTTQAGPTTQAELGAQARSLGSTDAALGTGKVPQQDATSRASKADQSGDRGLSRRSRPAGRREPRQ
jgi:hypothetical protein